MKPTGRTRLLLTVGVLELPPAPEDLHPLAAFLFQLCATVLGPKATKYELQAPRSLRCARCHNPQTRFHDPHLFPARGLGPLLGFTARCHCCNYENVLTTALGASRG